ncbi:cell wall hydrolase [Sphingobium wenxiniae]|uniref:Spore germination cell wall hydrolase CwlJ-like protein n=1 Tax=Sphingobium wenxiniae (strain DSM 21828 / CGMCC 1.7748 / JZ-1) TaxID=595605 RepID=A0A562KIW8_SPHWJ|nr:cell wall hydrolase [Sphingobium wenxiniae]TWH95320.1 spore germination cell wall hydrolase CwlJ-like protein [Sphingobium wenxiniae]
MWLLWLVLFVGLPMAIASWEAGNRPAAPPRLVGTGAADAVRPPSLPPPVEPLEVYALERDQARALNAAIPFSKAANPAARPFVFAGSEAALARATDCLAAAQLYESGDDMAGERAVAQVVLNRVRHPAFPKTVCGVVFQGQERTTGCQFTFTCDGALARTPGQAAWERARAIAKQALAGKVFKPVGHATHYHTDWVVPYWSGSLDKVTAVGTHLFFRWRGWWGTPPAFRKAQDMDEPIVSRIARLSPAHQGLPGLTPGMSPSMLAGGTATELAGKPQQPVEANAIAGARLVVMVPGAKSFLVELARESMPDNWPAMARTFCAGRRECRIMGWRAGNTPSSVPLSGEQMENMTFAYIHNAATGLQRSLWNCAQFPRANRNECMRQREPVIAEGPGAAADAPKSTPPLIGVRRQERFETVKIAPPTLPAVAAPTVKP